MCWFFSISGCVIHQQRSWWPSPRGAPIGDDQRTNVQAPGAAEDMEQPSGPADSAGLPSGAAQGIPGRPGEVALLITLTVNGEQRRIPADLTLPAALEALGYRPQLVVVEFNGEILPRQRWSEQPVVETDVLEVVTIVGGGS